MVTLDLATAQTFTSTTSEPVNQFTLLNVPDGSTSFTVKILQGSTAYELVLQPLRTYLDLHSNILAGGVIPYVTRTADKD